MFNDVDDQNLQGLRLNHVYACAWYFKGVSHLIALDHLKFRAFIFTVLEVKTL